MDAVSGINVLGSWSKFARREPSRIRFPGKPKRNQPNRLLQRRMESMILRRIISLLSRSRGSISGVARLAVWCFVLLLSWCAKGVSQNESGSGDKFKAVYIYNILHIL